MSGMIYVRPFGSVGATVNLVANGRIPLTRAGVGTQSVRVVNAGTTTAFIKFGDVTVTASAATDMPVLAGQTAIFLLPNYDSYAAVAGLTGTIYFTTGESS